MDLLALYLQDHHALSLGGLRLARRCLSENRSEPELSAFLARLVPELEEDRRTIGEALRALGAAPSTIKEAAIAVGEVMARLKGNGRLLSYSPLSRVWELEGLVAGTESRRALFRALARQQRHEPRLAGFGFAGLEERAKEQQARLEKLRQRASEEAFARGRSAGAGRPAHARG
jgi:hypothetical protein